MAEATRASGHRALAVLLALAVLAAFSFLGAGPVVTDNEGQRAVPPAEMLRSGDYVIPTINDEPYLVKPPLLYWAIAAVYGLTGVVDEWTARLPTALAGVVLVALTFVLLRPRLGEAAAWWAALAMLTSPYVLERVRWANLDIPLTLALFLAVLQYHEAVHAPGRAAWWRGTFFGGVAFGAALMLKGPPAFLFLAAAWMASLLLAHGTPGPAVRTGLRWSAAAFVVAFAHWGYQLAAFLLGWPLLKAPVALLLFVAVWGVLAWHGAPARTRARATAAGAGVIGIGLVLAAPWALAVLDRMTWPYLWAMLNDQVVERTYVASAINSGSPAFYALNLFALAAPWGFLLPLHASRTEWRSRPGFYRYCLVYGWLAVGLFSLVAGKEREYILPALPFLLGATGCHLSAFVRGRLRGWRARYTRVWLTCFQALAVVLVAGLPVYYATDLDGPIRWGFAAAAGAAAVLALGAWRNALRRRGGRRRHARLRMMAGCVLLAIVLFLAGRGYHYRQDPSRSPEVLGHVCRDLAAAGHSVAIAPRLYPRTMFPYPQLAFYIGQPIGLEADPAVVAAGLAGDAPYYYVVREKDVAAALGDAVATDGRTRVLLGPLRLKDLMLLGNAPLPDTPAVRSALVAGLGDSSYNEDGAVPRED